jgi:HNH endonuclease
MSVEEAIDPSNVGDICHIIPRGKDEARADPEFPRELLSSYANLILLCKIHHKIIDDHPDIYPADRLREIKNAHEQWVDSTLSTEQKSERVAKEQYAGILTEWEAQAEIARWDRWANLIANWHPQIYISDANKFSDLETWTSTRWWPHTLPVLEAAFVNYAKWLKTMQYVLYRHTHKVGDIYFTEKFYQNARNEEKYNKLYDHWFAHIKLLSNIMIEVCKSANLIATLVRRHITPIYRETEGRFSLQDTFTESGTVFAGVFEYDSEEIEDGLVCQRTELYNRIMANQA